MTSTRLTRGVLIAATVVLSLSACSSDDGTQADTSAAPTTSAEPTAVDTEPVGAGCAQLPADPAAPGSVAALAGQPVGTALATSPLLTSLASAVGQANLTAALDAQSDITVLAPANVAFDAIPPEDLNALLADLPRLTSVLQHHVIAGRIAPADLPGDHTTLLGDTVTVAGSGDGLTVSADQTVLQVADAALVCGNLQTANATVYVVDQVLAPEA